MADIDEELLALAGEASSDEEDAPMNISRGSPGTPDARKRPAGNKAATSKKSSGSRSARRANHNDSEEEGEA
jgi:RNA polymerase-associated protein RTF1